MRRWLVGVLLLAGGAKAQELSLFIGSDTVVKNAGGCSDVVSGRGPPPTWAPSAPRSGSG
jgi:hypothetical protein